ncbi:hypothetical protein VKT23_015149 [Stygiomarasmius scandens]|uniref:Uncharacterized protein n=1 Tax=Marasmiellus scandens TaxID=2682957 RepID=A0ABR1J1J5_9AGAR
MRHSEIYDSSPQQILPVFATSLPSAENPRVISLHDELATHPKANNTFSLASHRTQQVNDANPVVFPVRTGNPTIPRPPGTSTEILATLDPVFRDNLRVNTFLCFMLSIRIEEEQKFAKKQIRAHLLLGTPLDLQDEDSIKLVENAVSFPTF